MTLWFTRT